MELKSTGRDTEEVLETTKVLADRLTKDIDEETQRQEVAEKAKKAEKDPIEEKMAALRKELESIDLRYEPAEDVSREKIGHLKNELQDTTNGREIALLEKDYNEDLEKGEITDRVIRYIYSLVDGYVRDEKDLKISDSRIIGGKDLERLGLKCFRVQDGEDYDDPYNVYFIFYGTKCVALSIRRKGTHRGDDTTPNCFMFLESGVMETYEYKFLPTSTPSMRARALTVEDPEWERDVPMDWRGLVKALLEVDEERFKNAPGMDFYDETNKKFWHKHKGMW